MALNETKEKIKRFAEEKGFDDVRFIRAADLREYLRQNAQACATFCCAEDVLLRAKSIAVLFSAYSPSCGCADGTVHVSEYYRVSHRAWQAAKMVEAFIDEQGGEAALSARLPARSAAMLTGGFIGRNGFYYHSELGSFVCIHTIVTDLGVAPDMGDGKNRCQGCMACVRGCPSGAIRPEGGVDLEKCVRSHMNGVVPEPLREHVYQLLGCELCQLACPLNQKRACVPAAFDVSGLLRGTDLKELQRLVGKNMARKHRVLSQALLVAGARRDARMLHEVTALAASGNETVREHALWAQKRIMGEL